MTPPPVPPEELEAWHQALLRGDHAADERICRTLLPWLSQRLRDKYWPRFPALRLEPENAAFAANDTLSGFIRNPRTFRPECGVPLAAYFRMDAERNLLDRVRRAGHRCDREEKGDVEFWDLVPASASAAGTSPADLVASAEEREQLMAQLKCHFRDPLEWKLVCVMLDGGRHLEAYAQALGFTLPLTPEQEEDVRKHVHAVHQKLHRLRPKLKRPE